MSTEVRQGIVEQPIGAGQAKEIGPGGEEVYEVEKGVRVRKSGGVEFAPSLSAKEIESRRAELLEQIEHQKLVIARAKEESVSAARQANEQEILAREALEFKDFNRRRQLEGAEDAKSLLIEVSALIEKEKELERQRAAAHRACLEKESERVQAKTAEIMAREEAIEAEKQEQYFTEMARKCQALTLRYKLEEEQARLKMESLQFNLQHGEFRTSSAANKAKIVVEVEPRDLPEARQFDTSQVEHGLASAEINQEGLPTIADTRSIEEIVMAERKYRSAGTSQQSYASTQRGFEKRGETPSSILPSSTTAGDIKVLPEIKPSAVTESNVPAGSQAMASGEQYVSQQQYGQQQQPSGVVSGGTQSAEASTEIHKKQKGGFFKKFMSKDQKSHEQH